MEKEYCNGNGLADTHGKVLFLGRWPLVSAFKTAFIVSLALLVLAVALAWNAMMPAGVRADDTAPSDVKLKVKPHSIVVSWKAPVANGDVTGYRIMRRDVAAGDALSLLATVEASAKRYVDTDMTDQVTYEYGVQAVKGDEVGAVSTTPRATYILPLPKNPRRLVARPYERGMVLEWNAPPGPITGYQILRHKPKECEKKLLVYVKDTGNANTTYTDTDVIKGVKYIYRIKAINAKGMGTTSNAAIRKYRPLSSLTPPGAPGAPQGLNSRSVREGIKLTWSAPKDDKVTGYEILRRRPGECESVLRTYVENTGQTATKWIDTDVEVGTKYVYRVKAINEKGHGEQSDYTKVTKKRSVVILWMTTSGMALGAGGKKELTVGLSNLVKDDDDTTVDYTLRGDVTVSSNGDDADECEGAGFGQDIQWSVVDDDDEETTMIFGGDNCESGIYLLKFQITDHKTDITTNSGGWTMDVS